MSIFENLDNAFFEQGLITDPIAEEFIRLIKEAEEDELNDLREQYEWILAKDVNPLTPKMIRLLKKYYYKNAKAANKAIELTKDFYKKFAHQGDTGSVHQKLFKKHLEILDEAAKKFADEGFIQKFAEFLNNAPKGFEVPEELKEEYRQLEEEEEEEEETSNVAEIYNSILEKGHRDIKMAEVTTPFKKDLSDKTKAIKAVELAANFFKEAFKIKKAKRAASNLYPKYLEILDEAAREFADEDFNEKITEFLNNTKSVGMSGGRREKYKELVKKYGQPESPDEDDSDEQLDDQEGPPSTDEEAEAENAAGEGISHSHKIEQEYAKQTPEEIEQMQQAMGTRPQQREKTDKEAEELRAYGAQYVKILRQSNTHALVAVDGRDDDGNRITRYATVSRADTELEPGAIWSHLREKSNNFRDRRDELKDKIENEGDKEAARMLQGLRKNYFGNLSDTVSKGMKTYETQSRKHRPRDLVGYLKQQWGETPREMMINAYQRESATPSSSISRKDPQGQFLKILTQLDDADIRKLKNVYKTDIKYQQVADILGRMRQEFNPMEESKFNPYDELLAEAGWNLPGGGVLSSIGQHIKDKARGLKKRWTREDVNLARNFLIYRQIVQQMADDNTAGHLESIFKQYGIDVKFDDQARSIAPHDDARDAVPPTEEESQTQEPQSDDHMAWDSRNIRDDQEPQSDEYDPKETDLPSYAQTQEAQPQQPHEYDSKKTDVPKYAQKTHKLTGTSLIKDRQAMVDRLRSQGKPVPPSLEAEISQAKQVPPKFSTGSYEKTQKLKKRAEGINIPSQTQQDPRPRKDFFPEKYWGESLLRFNKKTYARTMLSDPILEEIRIKANDLAHLTLNTYINRCNELGRTNISSMCDSKLQKLFSESLNKTLNACQHYDSLLKKHKLGRLVDTREGLFEALVSLVYQTSSPLTEDQKLHDFSQNPQLVIESYHQKHIGDKGRSSLQSLSKII